MTKLWSKQSFSSSKNYTLDQTIERFETGDDLTLDNNLIEADVYGSLAHAKMLLSIGILTAQEFESLKMGLKKILDLAKEDKFNLEAGDEDVHTKIENFLTQKCGPAGQKIHTARSRNDQVLTAIRLYSKEELLSVLQDTLNLVSTLHKFAKLYEKIPMPGYTHMQKAMPSSVGVWASAYAESLLDDLELLKTAYQLNDQSPLGSAASYGVPLPINREMTSQLLGFAKVQNNVLYAQNSRGKIESIILSSLIQISFDISKFATDVLLFTTSEFNFFSIKKELTTGSSIMPQKFNLDLAELLRSRHHVMVGYLVQVLGSIANLPSGYNRDFQDTKKPLMDGFSLIESILKVAELLVQGLSPNKDVLEKAMTKELYATNKAYEMVKQGKPFRVAYREVASDLDNIEIPDLQHALKKVSHTGGSGNLKLPQLLQKVQKEKLKLNSKSKKFQQKLIQLTN